MTFDKYLQSEYPAIHRAIEEGMKLSTHERAVYEMVRKAFVAGRDYESAAQVKPPVKNISAPER